MGIGTGIVLGVLGLVLLTGAIQVDMPWVNEYTLGWILVLAGVVSIVLSLTIWRGAGGTRVVEREVDGPPV